MRVESAASEVQVAEGALNHVRGLAFGSEVLRWVLGSLWEWPEDTRAVFSQYWAGGKKWGTLCSGNFMGRNSRTPNVCFRHLWLTLGHRSLRLLWFHVRVGTSLFASCTCNF